MRDANAPCTCSEPGGKQWQHHIGDWDYWTNSAIIGQNWVRIGPRLSASVQFWLTSGRLWPHCQCLPRNMIAISITQLPLLATSPCLQCFTWPFIQACNSSINNLQAGTTLPHSLLGDQCSQKGSPCWEIRYSSFIARLMRPTWGPSGADRTQVGPMLAPCTLLSGIFYPTLWSLLSWWEFLLRNQALILHLTLSDQ